MEVRIHRDGGLHGQGFVWVYHPLTDVTHAAARDVAPVVHVIERSFRVGADVHVIPVLGDASVHVTADVAAFVDVLDGLGDVVPVLGQRPSGSQLLLLLAPLLLLLLPPLPLLLLLLLLLLLPLLLLLQGLLVQGVATAAQQGGQRGEKAARLEQVGGGGGAGAGVGGGGGPGGGGAKGVLHVPGRTCPVADHSQGGVTRLGVAVRVVVLVVVVVVVGVDRQLGRGSPPTAPGGGREEMAHDDT